MAQAAIVQGNTDKVVDKTKQTYSQNLVADVYLITNTGVLMMTGADANDLRNEIEQKPDHLDYRFFDDDNHRWAYWAVKDGEDIESLPFPDPQECSLTSSLLYTKAVTYMRTLAHAVGQLRQKPQTLWDKMLKPTTIIMAIVAIVFVMALFLVSMTG